MEINVDMLRDYTISEIVCALHARVIAIIEDYGVSNEELDAAQASGNIDEEKRLFVKGLKCLKEASPYYDYLRSIMGPGDSLTIVREFDEAIRAAKKSIEAYEKLAEARGAHDSRD